MQITRNSIETWPGRATGSPARSMSTRSRRRRWLAPVGEQRPLHAGRPDGVAHPPQRPDHLRHRGRRPRARRGGPIEVIRPGDRVFFEPGEEHWHGAAPNRFMTHLAMLEVDDAGNSATWGEHVTDEEYGQQPG